MELVWAIAFVLFAAAEIATVQLISIWFAFGALAAMLCVHFTDISVLGQLAVFIAVTAVLLAITFPLVRKRLNAKHTATNSDLDVGQTAIVIEEVNFDKGTGRVSLKGVDWNAVSENPEEIISVGSIVVVKEVQGAKLIIALKSEQLTDTV